MKSFLSTKMTSSRRTSTERRELYIIFGLFLPILLLLWLWPEALGRAGSIIFSPLFSSETKLRHSLLKQEEVPANIDEVLLARLEAENGELRSLLNTESESRIAAGVIGRPTNLPYDVLVIDKGSRDGIVEDAPVYAGEHQAIGFIVSVYPDSAVVALVTTPGWRTTVYIYGPNIYTVAEGQGGGVTRVHVPQGVKLTVGDAVIVPSLSSGIYGRISAIDSVPSRPEQYGYVAIETPINALRIVAVGERPLSVIDFETAKTVIQAARNELLQINVPEGVLIEAESDIASSSATSTTASTATSTETGASANP